MKLKIAAISLIAAGALSAAGYGLFQQGLKEGAAHAVVPEKTSTPTRQVLYWHDPMMPDQHFDKPGKSPFMDMDLVPVYAEAQPTGGITIPPQTRQSLGIRTAQVEVGQLSPSLSLVGNVSWDERTLSVIQARAGGFVAHLAVTAPMTTVRQGQVLAELVVPDWVAAQEEFLAVRGLAGETGNELRTGARQRMRLLGMSETQIAQVDRTGVARARLAITAPVSGVVTELALREGMTVTPGMTLFRINGLDSVWLDAELPEAQVALVTAGTRVTGSATAWPGKTFSGRIQTVLPSLEQATRTAKVRVVLDNRDHALLPGMFVAVQVKAQGRADREALLVPSEAVIRTGRGALVLVQNEAGDFSPVAVVTGLESAGRTAILSGLSAGQKVVVSGQFLLDSEASFKGVSSRMQAPDAPGDMAGRMDMRGMGQ